MERQQILPLLETHKEMLIKGGFFEPLSRVFIKGNFMLEMGYSEACGNRQFLNEHPDLEPNDKEKRALILAKKTDELTYQTLKENDQGLLVSYFNLLESMGVIKAMVENANVRFLKDQLKGLKDPETTQRVTQNIQEIGKNLSPDNREKVEKIFTYFKQMAETL